MNYALQLESLTRRINRRRQATIACWVFAALSLTLLGLMACDWLLGVHHVAARWALTLLLVSAVAAIVQVYRRRSAAGRTTPLAVALQLERLYPQHRSLLSSGYAFSQQDPNDATAGSEALRRAVVLQAAVAAESFDMDQLVPRAPMGRALVAAVVALAAVVLPAILAPQALATGLVRLMNPLSDAQWPRKHYLEFVDAPTSIPIGGQFQANLRDRSGRLPNRVTVEYRSYDEGQWRREVQRYAASGDSLFVQGPEVQQSFEYRATGGDDRSMAWHSVAVAPAPQLVSLSATVHPPAYTEWPASPLVEPYRVLAGSSIELSGAVDVQLIRGELRSPGEEPVELEIAPDGRNIAVPANTWKPTRSGDWTFRVTTTSGMVAELARQLHVDILPDEPPTAIIEQPADDQFVLPRGRIDLKLAAEDDVGVRSLAAELTPRGRAPGQAPARTELYSASGPAETGRREADFAVELAELAASPGDSWEVRAAAEDYAGQRQLSARPLRVTVISEQQFLQRLETMLLRLAAALQSALDGQRATSRQVETWRDATASAPSEADMLSASLRQRRTRETLLSAPESARALSNRLISELRQNRWPDDDALRRLEHIAEELGALEAGPLPDLETDLAQAARAFSHRSATAEGSLTNDAASHFEQLIDQSNTVIIALERLIDSVAKWRGLQQFQGEVADILTRQRILRRTTESSARAAILEGPDRIADDQLRRRRQAADEQLELASQLAGVVSRMREFADAQNAEAPLAIQVKAILQAVNGEGVELDLRAAADQLAAHRFAQAAAAQRTVESKLERLLERFLQNDAASANRLDELSRAERNLADLRTRTAEYVERRQTAERSAASPESGEAADSATVRRQIAEDARQLADQIEQLSAAEASQATRDAADKMARPTRTAADARDALSRLDDAERLLAADRDKQRDSMSRSQIEGLDSVVPRLIDRQQQIVQQIEQLTAREAAAAPSGKAHEADLHKLSMEQQDVRDQTRQQAQQVENLPVFARVLDDAAGMMENVRLRLAAGNGGNETSRLASRAEAQLQLLAAAVRQQRTLQSQRPPQAPSNENAEASTAGGDQRPDAGRLQQLQVRAVQLGLVRTLQAELERVTIELEKNAGQSDEASDRDQISAAANRQRDLAALVGSLLSEGGATSGGAAPSDPPSETAPSGQLPTKELP